MHLFHPLDEFKDKLAEHGVSHVPGIGTAYWNGKHAVFIPDVGFNLDIQERQRKHGWTATAQPQPTRLQ